MVRAASKNFKDVGVVVNPDDYSAVLKDLDQNQGRLGEELRFYLATRGATRPTNKPPSAPPPEVAR